MNSYSQSVLLLLLASCSWIDEPVSATLFIENRHLTRGSAQFVFRLNLEELSEWKPTRSVALDNFVKFDLAATNSHPRFRISDVQQVCGAIRLPSTISELQDGDRFKHDFVLRLYFIDHEMVDKIIEHFKLDKVNLNGSTYFKLSSNGSAQELFLRRSGKSSVDIGTKSFIQKNGRQLLTKIAASGWNKLSTNTIRVVFDTKNTSSLFGEIRRIPMVMNSPEWSEFMQLLENTNCIRIAIDPFSQGLMDVVFVVEDKAELVDTKSIVDGLVFVFRTKLNELLAKQQGATPKFERKHISTEIEGNSVVVSFTKPDGFDKRIGELVSAMSETIENKIN